MEVLGDGPVLADILAIKAQRRIGRDELRLHIAVEADRHLARLLLEVQQLQHVRSRPRGCLLNPTGGRQEVCVRLHVQQLVQRGPPQTVAPVHGVGVPQTIADGGEGEDAVDVVPSLYHSWHIQRSGAAGPLPLREVARDHLAAVNGAVHPLPLTGGTRQSVVAVPLLRRLPRRIPAPTLRYTLLEAAIPASAVVQRPRLVPSVRCAIRVACAAGAGQRDRRLKEMADVHCDGAEDALLHGHHARDDALCGEAARAVERRADEVVPKVQGHTQPPGPWDGAKLGAGAGAIREAVKVCLASQLRGGRGQADKALQAPRCCRIQA
mmetsp:Transcript_86094/g.221735  ORF Transcript_86094/g.221735 Transcript_86094/m.221735 type:complete len:323 (+) Transcript_86094:663-1631(+)